MDKLWFSISISLFAVLISLIALVILINFGKRNKRHSIFLITVMLICLGLAVSVFHLGVEKVNSLFSLITEKFEKPTYRLLPVGFDSIERKEWLKLLYSNPYDQKLWNTELKRLKGNERYLKQLPKNSQDSIKSLLAKNYQIQGVTLRHLNSHYKALEALSKSREILETLEDKYDCLSNSQDSICEKIFKECEWTFEFIANVYHDMNCKEQWEIYINQAFEYAKKVKNEQNPISYFVLWYLRNKNFDEALSIVFKAIEKNLQSNNKTELIFNCQLANYIYEKLFCSISWSLTTGKLRIHDPKDFVDMKGLGIGKDFKYGMISQEEDIATYATVLFYSGMSQLLGTKEDSTSTSSSIWAFEDCDLDRYTHEQLNENNFEPVAKYLYFIYIGSNFYNSPKEYLKCPAGSSYITFSDVQEMLEKTPSGTVSMWTIHVIELLQKGYQFLNSNCIR